MVAAKDTTIVCEAERFTYDDARGIAARVAAGNAASICIDLARAGDADLAAFAALVVLRDRLRRDGRDLWITGLRGRANAVYEVNRIGTLLPCIGEADRFATESAGRKRPCRATTG